SSLPLPIPCSPSFVTSPLSMSFLFSSTATPPPEIYTLSLHDALPILANRANSQIATNHPALSPAINKFDSIINTNPKIKPIFTIDRKSTRLNSSHVSISYAVFCLKKKKSEGQAVQDKVDNNGQQ